MKLKQKTNGEGQTPELCVPMYSTSMPIKKEVSCRISKPVPSCSSILPSPTCMPDLEMKNAKLRARPCMYASATAEMPGCSKPGKHQWKNHGSNIPKRSLENKTINISRKRNIEKYREVLWLLCHYYAIIMRYLWGTVDTWCWDWEWHGMTNYMPTAAHSST